MANHKCSLKYLIRTINERPYGYAIARPYYREGRKVISYAPVTYYNSEMGAFVKGGDIEGWINELPIGANIFIDTIVQEEKYSTEIFVKTEENLFSFSMRRSKNAKRLDEFF